MMPAWRNGRWALAVAACAAAALLPGCKGGGEGKSRDQVIHVTRNIGGRAGFQKHWDAWKAAFEKKNPGWKLELTDLGNADGAEYYKSRIATDDLPEIVMTWQLTKMLADAGKLQPLDDAYYTRIGLPLPTAYRGKRYTSQGGTQIQGIAVNKAMWASAGITQPPATWDELVADLRAIKAKGMRPLVFGAKEWSAQMPLYYALATSLYYDPPKAGQPSWTILRDQGKVKFATDPTMRKVMEKVVAFVGEFVDKGAGSDGYNEEQRDFYGGKGATWLMGCWLGGDIEANKVNFDIEYWPIPSMTGKAPAYLMTSGIPSGWAITTTAKGPKLEKARDALELFWDPQVFQLFLNGESQFGTATKVAATKPQSAWAPAQKLFDNMDANMRKYPLTPGYHLALDDMPPMSFVQSTQAVVQEIVLGTKDVDKLLKMLDDDWEAARKGM